MFGFSLTKILFTVAAIAVIWYGFKWVGRMQDQRERAADRRAKSARAKDSSDAPADAIEDMVACATCGDFVPAKGARACGRDNCPYPG
jgi:hypothetical protein